MNMLPIAEGKGKKKIKENLQKYTQKAIADLDDFYKKTTKVIEEMKENYDTNKKEQNITTSS